MRGITKGLLVVAGAIVAIGVAGSLADSSVPDPDPLAGTQGQYESDVSYPATTDTEEAEPVKAAEPAGIEDGTHEVGPDIKPGKYKSAGGETCYWARLSSLDNGLDDIIVNSISPGPQVVTVKRTDAAFSTQGCATWHKVAN